MGGVIVKVKNNFALNVDRLAAVRPAPGESMSNWDKIINPTDCIVIWSPDPAATHARLLSEGWGEDELTVAPPVWCASQPTESMGRAGSGASRPCCTDPETDRFQRWRPCPAVDPRKQGRAGMTRRGPFRVVGQA